MLSKYVIRAKLIAGVFAALFFLGLPDVRSAPGDVDLSFNPQISLNGSTPYLYAVKLQADGKILVGGQFTHYNGTAYNYIARANTDGSLDISFTSPLQPLSNADGIVNDIAIQPDGKILVGGQFNVGGQFKVLVRLNANGTLDNTFNANIGGDNIRKIVLQQDGKIIIGSNGLQTVDGTQVNYLARLNPNGSLHTALGVTGKLPGFVYSIALQPDGKIIVGGGYYLMRLNPNGTEDTGFTPTFGNYEDFMPVFYSVATQPDGKILAGGNNNVVTPTVTQNAVLIRVNGDGTRDTGFAPEFRNNTYVWAVFVQSDGKILVGGQFIRINNTIRGSIARLNTNGTLDSFHPNPYGANHNVYDIAVQTDGKVLIAGDFQWVGDFNNVSRTGFARLFDGPSTPPVTAKLKIAGGNVYVGSPGQGIILRSPGGTCRLLSIDNTGAMVLTAIACP